MFGESLGALVWKDADFPGKAFCVKFCSRVCCECCFCVVPYHYLLADHSGEQSIGCQLIKSPQRAFN